MDDQYVSFSYSDIQKCFQRKLNLRWVSKMTQTRNNKPFLVWLLIILHIFLGVGAVFGGGALVLSPNGSLLQMPLDILKYSPFHSYFFPGLILLVMLGVLPLIVSFFLFTKKQCKAAEIFTIYKHVHWAWTYSLYIGFIVILWITIETYMIQAVAFIHVFYVILGLTIQAITLLPTVQSYYEQ